jgi:hypothetical protein
MPTQSRRAFPFAQLESGLMLRGALYHRRGCKQTSIYSNSMMHILAFSSCVCVFVLATACTCHFS